MFPTSFEFSSGEVKIPEMGYPFVWGAERGSPRDVLVFLRAGSYGEDQFRGFVGLGSGGATGSPASPRAQEQEDEEGRNECEEESLQLPSYLS